MPEYTVHVGNVGQVHSGTDPIEARKHYDEYVAISRRGIGRAGGEQVTLFEDGEPIDEEEGGFEDYGDPTIPKCDSCQMLAINGLNTHELGCPNSRKTWEDGEWVLYRKCFTCGCDVRDGDSCCQDDE